MAYAGKNFGGGFKVGGPGGGAPPPRRRRIFENLKKFMRKMAKMLYFRLFCKKFQNHAINLCAFGRKTQLVGKFWEIFENFWWKCNGKIEFFSIFWENMLLKIETSEITSLFYNIFSGSVGGSNPPTPPPCVRHWNEAPWRDVQFTRWRYVKSYCELVS